MSVGKHLRKTVVTASSVMSTNEVTTFAMSMDEVTATSAISIIEIIAQEVTTFAMSMDEVTATSVISTFEVKATSAMSICEITANSVITHNNYCQENR